LISSLCRLVGSRHRKLACQRFVCNPIITRQQLTLGIVLQGRQACRAGTDTADRVGVCRAAAAAREAPGRQAAGRQCSTRTRDTPSRPPLPHTPSCIAACYSLAPQPAGFCAHTDG
jgi:hypothetical protein